MTTSHLAPVLPAGGLGLQDPAGGGLQGRFPQGTLVTPSAGQGSGHPISLLAKRGAFSPAPGCRPHEPAVNGRSQDSLTVRTFPWATPGLSGQYRLGLKNIPLGHLPTILFSVHNERQLSVKSRKPVYQFTFKDSVVIRKTYFEHEACWSCDPAPICFMQKTAKMIPDGLALEWAEALRISYQCADFHGSS